ncbi:MAG: flagellar basal body P-ring formation chaperone FlgA [bacterium]|nr:flagellar basal body P-ring formation chaperone FlgA [candidate division KSB1 bacterium]MDH7559320.1 flagellar basal body P-ring formation chaperone FlgA [bacterium]
MGAEQIVRQAIAEYVIKARQNPAEELEVSCGVVPTALQNAVKAADSLRVWPANGDADLCGKVIFSIAAQRNGEVIGQGHVLATVQVFTEVAVTRRRLDRNEMLSVAEVGLERRELTQIRGTPVCSLAEVLGKRTRRIVSAGQVLRREDIELPPVVRRGEVVTLLMTTKNLSVSLKVTALQDGAMGERIAVRSEDGKRYAAEVKEPGLVLLRP